MLVVAIMFAVVAVAAVVVAIVAGRRLRAQRAAADERAAEAAAAVSAREAADRARGEAEERSAIAESTRADAEEVARQANEEAAASAEAARLADERAAATEARATATEVEIEQARRDADDASQARRAAEHRADEIERRAATAAIAGAAAVDDAPPAAGELDAQIVWALERSRTERTWRQSVAIGPTGESILAAADDPLHEALQIELDAAREEVGAVVELDAELPTAMSAASSVLVLRAAQELLADVVRRSESTTLRVRADGDDVLVTVDAEDDEGRPVMPGPLPLPPTAAIAPLPNGVRLRTAARNHPPDT